MDRQAKINAGKRLAEARRKKLAERAAAKKDAEIAELRAKLEEKNREASVEYKDTKEVSTITDSQLDELKAELTALKAAKGIVDDEATQPWHSVQRPFYNDKFRLKSEHSGFYPVFVDEGNIDRFQSQGYVVADGSNWGETGGVVKRGVKSILMECPIKMREANKAQQREFNLAQRRSAIGKPQDAARRLGDAAGESPNLKFDRETVRQ